jgi:hypothetical protein
VSPVKYELGFYIPEDSILLVSHYFPFVLHAGPCLKVGQCHLHSNLSSFYSTVHYHICSGKIGLNKRRAICHRIATATGYMGLVFVAFLPRLR